MQLSATTARACARATTGPSGPVQAPVRLARPSCPRTDNRPRSGDTTNTELTLARISREITTRRQAQLRAAQNHIGV